MHSGNGDSVIHDGNARIRYLLYPVCISAWLSIQPPQCTITR